MTPGTCRYCTCTETQACDGGCAWVDSDPPQTLCTPCFQAEEIARRIVDVFAACAGTGSIRRLKIRLVPAVWADLDLDQRQLLVMTCRATVDTFRESLIDRLTEDAFIAGVELHAITGFLLEKCPGEILHGEPVHQMVIRLLEPHVGTRIVMPPGVLS